PQPGAARLRAGSVNSETRWSDSHSPLAQLRSPGPGRERESPAELSGLDLSGLGHDLSRWEVKVLSPDAAQPQFAGLSLHGSVCEFTLSRIEHYTVVTLSAKSAP